MLALLAAFLISLSGARAQTYTPVPYNFGNIFEVNDGTSQTPTDFSIDCMAANNYGIWTSSYMSSASSTPQGLLLLGNGLRGGPASNMVSTGIVGTSTFTPGTSYPIVTGTSNLTDIKVACNLKGQVRYVWPSADHNSFIVQGFDECSESSITGINLQFKDFPYNADYTGNGFLAENVIKASSTEAYPSVPAADMGGIYHPVVTMANEVDPRDWFDVAIDGENLYIVWEEYNAGPGTYNIWVRTEDLNTGAITDAIQITPVYGPPGQRPTIAADVRIAGLPNFDLAYIVAPGTAGAMIEWVNYTGGSYFPPTVMSMSKICQFPGSSSVFPYTIVSHVRILDASTEGYEGLRSAIYAIVQGDKGGGVPDGKTHLIMHKIKYYNPDPQAYYSDGYMLYNHATGVDDGYFDVVDNPIRAFANPYDGESDNDYDEYHCLYQLARVYTPDGINYITHYPLMIVHGAMVFGSTTMAAPKVCVNLEVGPLPWGGTPTTIVRNNNTELGGHTFYLDPGPNTDGGYTDNYNGAVNQMGIHVYWRNATEHYYLRDRRTFDENIEENTLATDDVYVGDGTSHFGDYPPTLQPGKNMAFYSNPNETLFINRPDPVSINFPTTTGDATELVIGTGSGAPSSLVVLRRFWDIAFNRNQLIHVKPGSVVQWFSDYEDESGCLSTYEGPWPNGGLKLEGSGATIVGGDNGYPSDPISNPATLNIYPGTLLKLGQGAILDASSSLIVSLPPRNDITWLAGWEGLDHSGTILLYSGCYLTDCITKGTMYNFAPPSTALTDNLFWFGGNSASSETIQITNSLFESDGGASILFGKAPWCTASSDEPVLPVTISGGKFDNTMIQICFPLNPTTIEDAVFDNIPGGSSQGFSNDIFIGGTGAECRCAISMEKAPGGIPWSYSEYGLQTISGCHFRTFSDNNINGITIHKMNNSASPMNHVHIVDNTFTTDNTASLGAAIYLTDASQAFVENNTITGTGFEYGIRQGSYTYIPESYVSESLICSNTIQHSSIAGISTGYWDGYSKLNSVSACAAGHQFFNANWVGPQPVIPSVVFSNYSNNVGPGIQTLDPDVVPDLSGVHSDFAHPHDQDYAAFDTIENNGTAQIMIAAGLPGILPTQGIYLGNAEQTSYWTWSDWSRNNILMTGCESCSPTLLETYIGVEGGGTEPDPDYDDNLGDMSQNFWGTSGSALINPIFDQKTACAPTSLSAPSSWLLTPDGITRSLTFCYSVPTTEPICTTWTQRVPGTIFCGDEPTITYHKNAKPQSILTDTSCQDKYNIAEGCLRNYEYDLAYSWGKLYLETCYDSGHEAFIGFGVTDGAVQNLSTDPSRYVNYREWLKSVLWLNQVDPGWYCACAGSIIRTYNTSEAADYNAMISIERYLLQSGHCAYEDSGAYGIAAMTSDTGLSRQRKQNWLDTVFLLHNGDTTHFPEDTTIPSIHDLGLDILMGPPSAVSASSPSEGGIGQLIASENPFPKETTVSFQMGEYAYVSFQVFDVLGKVVQGDFKGTVLNPGMHTFAIDGTNLPSGTYYARISTPIGETRTVKLVKE